MYRSDGHSVRGQNLECVRGAADRRVPSGRGWQMVLRYHVMRARHVVGFIAAIVLVACERPEADLGRYVRTLPTPSAEDTAVELAGPTLTGDTGREPAEQSRARRPDNRDEEWSTRPRFRRGDDSVRVLTSVRWAQNAGFDRWVFEFAGGRPSVAIAWTPSPGTECGSGARVEAPGRAWLRVRFSPAQAHTDAGATTIPRRRIPANLPATLEAVLVCDVEADVTWVLAADRVAPVRLLSLDGPPRVVIDVAHLPR